MPKARANINVYSSTRFSGFYFWRRKNCTIWWYQELHGMWYEIGQASLFRATERNSRIRREEPSFAITADLRLFVTHTGLTVSTALFTRHPWRVAASISMQNVNWRTRRSLFFHHFSNYSTHTYVVVVLFVVIPRSTLHTDSAKVPVLHTSAELAEAKCYVYHELPGMW